MSNDHYFSASPGADKKVSRVSFQVAGQEITAKASSGTFSSGGLDKGTKVLLSLFELFPEEGDVLDLGCGWGPIALSIATINPETKIFAVDVNQRSLEMTQENAKELGLRNIEVLLPDQLDPEKRFSEIWSNPPIRIGKTALHQLLEQYLPKLVPGGKAMMVVQKQLGAESLLKWLKQNFPEHHVEKVHSDKGYWVLRVISPTHH